MRGPLNFSVVVLSLIALPSTAAAFCRTTTCNPNADCASKPDECCEYDDNHCDTKGLPLFWASSCVSWSVQEDGSPKNAISAQQTEQVLTQAFQAWQDVLCSEQPISIHTEYLGTTICGEQLFSKESGNANIWMYRDDYWPYSNGDPSTDVVSSNALALTTVTFNAKTGEMLDADVEINTADMHFSLTDYPVENDLLSIVTHEAGHFLGLDHSISWDATMSPGYAVGSTSQRSLSPDDQAGICSIYPTPRDTETGSSCSPHGGFTESCVVDGGSCAMGPRPSGSAWPQASLWLIPAALSLRIFRRRLASKTQL